MKGILALFDQINGRPAAALLRDGQLDDLLIDPPDDRIRPGAVYRARATRPLKGQGGMILETVDGPLFLRQSKGIAPGATLLVQTTTYAEARKAAPCTTRVLFKSRFCIVTPGAPGLNISRGIKDEERRAELRALATDVRGEAGHGLILRSISERADDDAIAEDILAMSQVALDVLSEGTDGPIERLLDGPGAEDLAYRDWPIPDTTEAAPGAFDAHDITGALDKIRKGVYPLSPSGSIAVEATRAFVAVDVDTGGDTSQAAGLKANIAAVRTLPRALRLAGLGGQIVIDLAPMPKRDRARVEQQIASAFRADPIETSFVGWTPLGHAELQRKRERLPLSACLS